jgi:N utilization substance protein A
MNKEILLVAEAVSNEKDVPKEVIFEAIEIALATATKKRYDEEADIRVAIDRMTGEYTTTRHWSVVGDDVVALLGTELTLQEAAEKASGLQDGDVWQEEVENVGFGRIAAQTAKQVIDQKVRASAGS